MKINDYINSITDKINHSIFYEFFHERIDDRYNCMQVPFKEEFLFFEHDYVCYYKDIFRRKLNVKYKKIIDIGCQFGFQSEIFKRDFKYIGIDSSMKLTEFFNFKESICTYYNKPFPMKLDYEKAIVISNMSLGYFNEGFDMEGAIRELKKADYIYIRTSREFLERLKPYFMVEHLPEDTDKKELESNVHNNRYFLKRKEN